MPSVVTSSTGIATASQHDDGAQHLAALHLVERLLDVVERDLLATRSGRGRAGPGGRGRSASGSRGVGRQSPYQLDLSAPPRPNTSMNGSSIVTVGRGTPTSTTVPARSRASNAWRYTVGLPIASMHTSAPKPPVTDLMYSTGSVRRRVARCGSRRTPSPTRACGRRCRRRRSSRRRRGGRRRSPRRRRRRSRTRRPSRRGRRRRC